MNSILVKRGIALIFVMEHRVEQHVPTELERAERLRRMMNAYIRTMSPQERDRIMQVHLAQARGPELNARLLCSMMNFWIRAGKKRQKEDGGDGV